MADREGTGRMKPGDDDWRTALLDRYRVTSGAHFRLADHDPGDRARDLVDKRGSEALLAAGVARLGSLHDRLSAQDRWAVLCVLQAMDAAGKDGTISHVLTGVNPQGIRIRSFKAPGPEDLAHDFLWRIHAALPPRGSIGILNRSHYEEVLVVRVHPEILAAQHLPAACRSDRLWEERLHDIAAFESYLARQGTAIVKFFLNVSPEEQRQRLLARLDDPAKLWKFAANDIKERAYWQDYRDAYQQAIAATARPEAPWFVVPADHKWFAHLVVVEALIEAIEGLDLKLPDPDPARQREFDEARRQLEAES